MAPEDPPAAASETVPAATEVIVSVDSACSSPYITAPSSPKHPDSPSSSSNSPFSTAPPSPTSAHQLSAEPSLSIRPFHPNPAVSDDDEGEFAFEFTGHLLDSAFLSAEELFDGGVIRPLRPITRLQLSSQLAESTRGRGPDPTNKCVFRSRKFNFEYPTFEASAESARRDTGKEQITRHKNLKTSSFKGSSCSSCSSFRSCKKWKLRDLLSFRGGSGAPAVRREGGGGDDKALGFGRSSGGGGGGPSGSGRRGSVLNRRFQRSGSKKTDSGEVKRKGETTSSCRQGFWECMRRFHHGEAHGLVKGIETASSRG